MARAGEAVYATLLMNDEYLPGAMVLGHSLKDRGAKAKLVAFVLVDRLAGTTITQLKSLYDDIVPVQQIINKTPANLYLMDRPDLVSTFTKIELWKQTQFKRIVYIDADVVALRAPNELLTMDTDFAAVPDVGWPDCFNSGMLVLNPNLADYYSLLALAERGISFDGGDQGLLNMHFREWDRLSFTYNCTPSGNYQYVPAYKHFQSSINLVHFIGREKPWNLGRINRFSTGVYGELLARWWAVYDRHYRAQETVYYGGNYQEAPKKVQDFVAGEQTMYLPAHQAPSQSNQQNSTRSDQQSQAPAATPKITVQAPHDESGLSIEQPMGDPTPMDEQVETDEFKPTSTVEQRRWSAPHVEWEPARAPPPTNSKPEAQNFPSTIYEMSEDKQLFQPPARYPEAPKDMWYEVPAKVPEPPKPKPIFPWESRAPKPTRVFVEPKAPSPPPEPVLQPIEPDPDVVSEPGIEESSIATPSVGTDQTDMTDSSISTEPAPYVDPWTTFNQRTNAWDEMPEITKYMESLNQNNARKGKIQVLHHTPSAAVGGPGDVTSPPPLSGRRESLRITDFPTAVERPSLPVTPAPIRRNFWGDDKDEEEDTRDLPRVQRVFQNKLNGIL